MTSGTATAQDSVFEADSTAGMIPSRESNNPVGMDRLCLLLPNQTAQSHKDDTNIIVDFPRDLPSATHTPSALIERKGRVVRIPTRVKMSGLFVAAGKWEGIVESIDEEAREFEVRMVDILNNSDDLFMTFSMEDVSIEDKRLVVPGAVFYWVVGYYDQSSGQRTRVAELKFRRLPVRRARDLAKARERAKATRTELGL